jgi:hypothetical protein
VPQHKLPLPDFLVGTYTQEEWDELSSHKRSGLKRMGHVPKPHGPRKPIPEGYTEEEFMALPDHQKYWIRNPDAYRKQKEKNKEWALRVDYGKTRYERDRFENFEAYDAKQFKDNLWRSYKITPEQYWDIHKAQNGLCAVCRKPETATIQREVSKGIFKEFIYRLSVDHEHTTNRIRGLLCRSCNKRLHSDNGEGLSWIKAAANYLNQAEGVK